VNGIQVDEPKQLSSCDTKIHFGV